MQQQQQDRGVPSLITFGIVSTFALMGLVFLMVIVFVLTGVFS